MAFAEKVYTFSSSKTFNVSFDETGGYLGKPYISSGHLKVYVTNSEAETTDVTSDCTFDESGSPTTVTIGSSTTLVAGDAVKIRRETPRTVATRTVDFVDGSTITEADLDKQMVHNLFINQENLDQNTNRA